jgi:hypothetical protein
MDISGLSLFPEKFRSPNERRTAQGYGTILGILGLVMGFLITGFAFPETMDTLTRPEQMSFYRLAATYSLIGGFILFPLVIPGISQAAGRIRAGHPDKHCDRSD